MSNVSGVSSGSSSQPRGGRVVGIPKRCWCGEVIKAKLSKSESNPYRRYFRCDYAASNKLSNDNHVFKWVDDAILEEIETLTAKNHRLEQELTDLKKEKLVFEKMVFEKVQLKVEKVEEMLSEAKASMRNMLIGVALGFVIYKLVG